MRMLTHGRDDRAVRLIAAMVRARARAAEIRRRIQAPIADLLVHRGKRLRIATRALADRAFPAAP